MFRPTPPSDIIAVPGLEVAGMVAPLIATLMSILAPPTTVTKETPRPDGTRRALFAGLLKRARRSVLVREERADIEARLFLRLLHRLIDDRLGARQRVERRRLAGG